MDQFSIFFKLLLYVYYHISVSDEVVESPYVGFDHEWSNQLESDKLWNIWGKCLRKR